MPIFIYTVEAYCMLVLTGKKLWMKKRLKLWSFIFSIKYICSARQHPVIEKTYCSVPWVIHCKKVTGKCMWNVHASIGKFSTENLAFSSIWFSRIRHLVQFSVWDSTFDYSVIVSKNMLKFRHVTNIMYHIAASSPWTCMQILELYVEGTYDKIYT